VPKVEIYPAFRQTFLLPYSGRVCVGWDFLEARQKGSLWDAMDPIGGEEG
jgi:hypothetical protein